MWEFFDNIENSPPQVKMVLKVDFQISFSFMVLYIFVSQALRDHHPWDNATWNKDEPVNLNWQRSKLLLTDYSAGCYKKFVGWKHHEERHWSCLLGKYCYYNFYFRTGKVKESQSVTIFMKSNVPESYIKAWVVGENP